MLSFAELRAKDTLTVCAVESSCDETACAVLRNGEVLSSVISTQIAIHKEYGGVVPEIASRNHVLNVETVVKSALEKAGVRASEVAAYAVTYGAGLLGALLVGVSYVKGLAFALDKPLVKVNHIRGHIAANYLADPSLVPPYIGLIVSGGHTAVVRVDDYTSFTYLGGTMDDAVGEAFDKVARVLSLPYPGGPEIEKLAREGEDTVFIPAPKTGKYDFSFSGIKTSVINYVHTAEQRGEPIRRADVACSFQTAVTAMLTKAAVTAAKENRLKDIALAGGVGANGALRATLTEACAKNGLKAHFPTKEMCTDNAAMIAMEAYLQLRYGDESCLASDSLDAKASIPLCERG
ncbi:MAG: tRNA (adenosine(37)-N6)-threonylcarbamoyltransferase complex transferase subunit TsaD [Clostridia bacterium]|nr:tRNA (adenosine(37)-N6)-threonylcarbamoyltransferase complex transferase subunit TsaD [Clostridia bacterium]